MAVKIIECPRDAMQGFKKPISTDDKINYLNLLCQVGFDIIDCGSFVSAKAVPQLADTHLVLNAIEEIKNNTKLLCIIANERGAEESMVFKNVTYLGFPFSISESFQHRNTNKSISDAYSTLKNIIHISGQEKEVVVYLSMGFGNPYQEPWSTEIALEWCKKIADLGVKTISLSDTIGVAQVQDIKTLFNQCLKLYPEVEFGAHFHTRPDTFLANISAAYESGCKRFDSAMRGFGGCPFANDELMGNLPTESLIAYLNSIKENTNINQKAFDLAYQKAGVIFS